MYLEALDLRVLHAPEHQYIYWLVGSGRSAIKRRSVEIGVAPYCYRAGKCLQVPGVLLGQPGPDGYHGGGVASEVQLDPGAVFRADFCIVELVL
jgi:hypothetical protein